MANGKPRNYYDRNENYVIDPSSLPQPKANFTPLFDTVTITAGTANYNFFKHTIDNDGKHITNMILPRQLQEGESMNVKQIGVSFPKGIIYEDWDLIMAQNPYLEFRCPQNSGDEIILPLDWFKQMLSVKGAATEKVEVTNNGLTMFPQKLQIPEKTNFVVDLKVADGTLTGLNDTPMRIFLVGPSLRL